MHTRTSVTTKGKLAVLSTSGGFMKRTALMLALALAMTTEPVFAWDIASAVNSCSSKSELVELIRRVNSSAYADAALAGALASHLSGGTRWFDRGGHQGDPIEGIGAANGIVEFTYHRNGRRWGYAAMSAHRVGGYVVLVGDWWQQSRMNGRSTTIPAIPPYVPVAIPVPWGMAFRDDHGACIYVFAETVDGFRSVTGTGCDLGDASTNPNWLTGHSGQ